MDGGLVTEANTFLIKNLRWSIFPILYRFTIPLKIITLK